MSPVAQVVMMARAESLSAKRRHAEEKDASLSAPSATAGARLLGKVNAGADVGLSLS